MAYADKNVLASDLNFDPVEANDYLEKSTAVERLQWASEKFESGLVLSSSFGA